MNMIDLLKILTWNANGLLKKIEELEVFLQKNNIDICLISETHLKKGPGPKIKGYSDYHAHHPSENARGGSSLYIKECIKHSEDIVIELNSMQISSVLVKINHLDYHIGSCYFPPGYRLVDDDLDRLFDLLGSNFIIGGDFNAKHTFWGSRCNSTKGRLLYKASMKRGVDFFSTGKPTYWPTDRNKIPDLVDFFIAKGITKNLTKVEECYDLCSDHSAVTLQIGVNVAKKEGPLRLTSNKTNWDVFRKDCKENVVLNVPLKTPLEIENEIDSFVEAIQGAAWKNTPCRNIATRNNKVKYQPEIEDLIREKRRARKRWQQSRAPPDKTYLNHLCIKLKNMLQDLRNRENSTYLESLTADKSSNYSLWKALKSIKKPVMHSPPLRKANGEWAKGDKEKADLFAEHLEETFKPFDGQPLIEGPNDNTAFDNYKIKAVSLSELRNTIRNLKNNKAPGYDLITGEILKELPKKALVKLLYIVNASLRLLYVPRQWKVAEVIMVPKPGKCANDKKSYRPISLLPIISKVFEKILLKRIQPVIEEKRLIPDHQFGFRVKHSTIDQVYRITNEIEKALEGKKICSSAFLDVSQAFDKVWHEGLRYKLRTILPDKLYRILESYLENRLFRVKHGTEYSEFKEIYAGVPQGSVLGPILFLLYTRDIPQDEGTIVATFADDTAILAMDESVESSTRKLQRALNKVYNWTKTWRIVLNETKSTHVNFTYKKVNNLPIYINSVQIPYANEAKYLGMTLDAKLKWKPHVKKKRDELEIRLREMYWLLGRYSKLNIYNKLLLYKQVLKPSWTYGIELWGCTKPSNMTLLQTFQNKTLRAIVNAPWYIRNSDIHRDLGIATVSDEVANFARKLYTRIHVHCNNEIVRSLDVTNLERRLQRTRPFDLAL